MGSTSLPTHCCLTGKSRRGHPAPKLMFRVPGQDTAEHNRRKQQMLWSCRERPQASLTGIRVPFCEL